MLKCDNLMRSKCAASDVKFLKKITIQQFPGCFSFFFKRSDPLVFLVSNEVIKKLN